MVKRVQAAPACETNRWAAWRSRAVGSHYSTGPNAVAVEIMSIL